MAEEKICPRCSEKFSEYPALSRRDNSTDICSECGTKEAMCDFIPLDRIPSEDLLTEMIFQKKIGVDFKDWKIWKENVDISH